MCFDSRVPPNSPNEELLNARDRVQRRDSDVTEQSILHNLLFPYGGFGNSVAELPGVGGSKNEFLLRRRAVGVTELMFASVNEWNIDNVLMLSS